MIEAKNKTRIDWWIYSVPVLIILTLLQYYTIFNSQNGSLRILFFYLAPYITTFLAVLFLIIAIIYCFRKKPFFNPRRIIGFVSLISLCFTSFLYNEFPSTHDDKPSKINFRLPLDTAVTIAWGGKTEQENYHAVHPDQRWAYDILVVKNDKTFFGDSTKLTNYYCYGLPILSPADGKIIAISDNYTDMAIGEVLGEKSDPGGNQIIIEVAPKEFLFLCHLKPKSIKVKVCDTVKQGQELALLGNSGNTSEPHIHIHLQDTKTLNFGQGIPLYFSNYICNGKRIQKGIPTGGFNDNGDFIGQMVQHAR